MTPRNMPSHVLPSKVGRSRSHRMGVGMEYHKIWATLEACPWEEGVADP